MLRSLLGTLAAVGTLLADAGPTPAGPPGISPDTQFTPVAGLVLTSPVPVTAFDGKVHFAYELVLTSPLRFEVDINTVEVRDAASKRGRIAHGIRASSAYESRRRRARQR